MRGTKRLHNEYKKFYQSPPENIQARIKESLILEWHFLFTGLNGTPFEGGEYHGMLMFSEDYPFSPPSIRFITPNGRFKTNERVCFELSDFHPECWKPAYTVSAVLQGVYSFMMSETTDTVGSLVMNEEEIRELAGKSKDFNFQDGSVELFQDNINVELTENSDANTDRPPDKMKKPDVTQNQSDSSQELLKLTLSFSPKNENNLSLKLTLSWPKHLEIDANRMRLFYCYLEYKFSQMWTIEKYWELCTLWYEYQ